MTLKVGIIGCGRIGHKRAESLPQGYLKAVADISEESARRLSCLYAGVDYSRDWRAITRNNEIDMVIVSTTNNSLAEITLAAVESGKHVLVEKPAARNYRELDPVLKAAENNEVKVTIGYNLRFHPSFMKIREIVGDGILGNLMYIRGRYGHGGRLGYEKEWRADPMISGGGELLDQGVHLIDLSRWFLGDIIEVEGEYHTYFWKMPVEDNAFLRLKNKNGQLAWLHASCTEWKNTFSFEIFLEKGKLQVDGLGGSYGAERLTCYQMLPQMGPPNTTIWEYPFPDPSWKIEFDQFEHIIRTDAEPAPSLSDAREILKIVDKIYGEGP
ncbi:MAG TPA: Gfo/Idh/MocA family oxidoreductase [Methanoregulaceae archaeon]|nr:Gfo/Idh/MocA family oxidoreductase [Methanoregulaceae archaeon]HQP82361.1 Gfo/Idh/MocA family oxidoreductase [Methanoregulaceae archaeon]